MSESYKKQVEYYLCFSSICCSRQIQSSLTIFTCARSFLSLDFDAVAGIINIHVVLFCLIIWEL